MRGVLAAGLVVMGAFLIARMLSFGFRMEIVPGVILGAAMSALGIHRLSLIARMRRPTP